MLEFFETYGASIVSIVVAMCGICTSIYGMTKTLGLGKKVDENNATTKQEISVTREGIVEAFKSAKIPTEWKVDVSNKINTTLSQWRDDLITTFKTNQALTNEMLLMVVKILNYTAASSKLTDEEKTKLDELVRTITDEDKTIDVSE